MYQQKPLGNNQNTSGKRTKSPWEIESTTAPQTSSSSSNSGLSNRDALLRAQGMDPNQNRRGTPQTSSGSSGGFITADEAERRKRMEGMTPPQEVAGAPQNFGSGAPPPSSGGFGLTGPGLPDWMEEAGGVVKSHAEWAIDPSDPEKIKDVVKAGIMTHPAVATTALAAGTTPGNLTGTGDKIVEGIGNAFTRPPTYTPQKTEFIPEVKTKDISHVKKIDVPYMPEGDKYERTTIEDVPGTRQYNVRRTGDAKSTTINQTDPTKIASIKDPGTFQGGQIAGVNMAGQADPLQAQQMQAAQINAPQQFRGTQEDLVRALVQQASGQGPSLASMQLQEGQEANIDAVMAQLASTRGGGNPLMARQAMSTAAEIRGSMARDAAKARMEEQMQAQGLLADVSGQARNQDIQTSMAQAQLDQDAGLANQSADLQAKMATLDSNTQRDLANLQADLQQKVAQGQLDQSTAELIYNTQAQKNLAQANLEQDAFNLDSKNELATNLTQAELDQERKIRDANANQETEYRQAELRMEAYLQDAKANLETALAQGKIDSERAAAIFDSIQKKALMDFEAEKIHKDRIDKYNKMGMDADVINQGAILERLKMDQDERFKGIDTTIAADEAYKRLVGQTLGAAGQMGAGIATGGA